MAVAAREVVALQGGTMGTTWSVKATASSPEESRAFVALQPRIEAFLERFSDLMSTYRAESELSRFNRHASVAPFTVSAETAHVVERALAIGRDTSGAFDITLGPVISLWGFDAEGHKSAPPPKGELARARERVGLDKLAVDGSALVKRQPDVVVNLNGIAPGYAVDLLFALVVEAGFKHVLVDIGGEMRAAGENARGEPWRVGINVPRSDADPTAVLVAVPLVDRALATSGDYRNFFESGGRRYGHIIDPTTGEPVQHHLISVTVIAPDCTTADALATAAMVLGEEKMRLALERFPGVEALFVHAQPGAEQLTISKTGNFPRAL